MDKNLHIVDLLCAKIHTSEAINLHVMSKKTQCFDKFGNFWSYLVNHKYNESFKSLESYISVNHHIKNLFCSKFHILGISYATFLGDNVYKISII